MINSRKISELHPYVAELCKMFKDTCAEEGIDILITSTFRDRESQDALYAQGRTAPGRKVTNARGGYSYHNHRVAFDFVPMVNGKCQWGDTGTFNRCGAIAKKIGLEWAGDWKRFKELAHCQYSEGLTTADFRKGKEIKGG